MAQRIIFKNSLLKNKSFPHTYMSLLYFNILIVPAISAKKKKGVLSKLNFQIYASVRLDNNGFHTPRQHLIIRPFSIYWHETCKYIKLYHTRISFKNNFSDDIIGLPLIFSITWHCAKFKVKSCYNNEWPLIPIRHTSVLPLIQR